MDYDFVLVFATIYTVIFEMIPAQSDPATWYAMYKMSYPFNVHTLHGYFGYLIMITISLHTYAILITSQAGFFLGSCFYLDAFTQDFDQSMKQLNQFDRDDSQSIRNIQKQFADAVKFNIRMIEFVIFWYFEFFS